MSLIAGDESSSSEEATRARFEQFAGDFKEQLLRVDQQNPLADFVQKLGSEHISTALENSDKAHRREVDYVKNRDTKGVVCILAFMAFVAGIVFLLLDYQRTEHLDAILAALMGFGGGLGVGRWTKSDDE